MAERFSIFYAGELLPGQDQATVREALARLFRANEASLDALFSGRMVAVKRDCDRATAARYQQAMREAGAEPIVRQEPEPATAATPTPAPQAPSGPGEPTMAERLAALTGESPTPQPEGQQPATQQPQAHKSEPPAAPRHASSHPGPPAPYTVAEVGAMVLTEAERRQPPATEIDTSALQVAPPAERLAPPPPEPPPAPDVSGMDLAAAGEVLQRPVEHVPVALEIDHLDLSPAGTDFADCTPPPTAAPVLDLSGLELGAPGSDVLEARYRETETASPPDTGHLSLTE